MSSDESNLRGQGMRDRGSSDDAPPDTAPPDEIPFTTSSRETRNRIINGADDFVMREGIYRMTMDRLAAHLRMSKKTIYSCFRSKDEILQAVLRRALGDIETRLRSIREDPDASTGLKLRRTRDAVIKRVSRLGLRLLHDLFHVFPELWRELDAHRTRILTEHFGELLREGAAAGEIRPDVQVDRTAVVIVKAISNVGQPGVLIDQPYSADEFITTLFALLFTGVLSEQGMEEYITGDGGGDRGGNGKEARS